MNKEQELHAAMMNAKVAYKMADVRWRAHQDKQLRDALAENEELKGRFNQCEKNYKELAKLFFSAEATIERIEAGIKEYLDWPECESCVEDHFRELLEQQE